MSDTNASRTSTMTAHGAGALPEFFASMGLVTSSVRGESRDDTRGSEPPGAVVIDHVVTPMPLTAPPRPQESSCPPPLAWQEVLAAYRADSAPWELHRGTHRLVGRTWGEGPPLYLLNGFASTAEMYALTLW